MQSFDYIAAHSVEEAISLLSQDGKQARVLGGGTDLLVQLREGRSNAQLIIDIKHIPEANELTYDPSCGLQLGAAVPCYRVYGNAEIAAAYPGLIDAVSMIGGIQIQGRATVGGNLCNASPAADSIPPLIVHQATCVIAGPSGQREVPVESFCTAPGQNALREDEFLVSLHLPPPQPGFGAHYLRFTPRNEMDIAVVGAGAAVMLDDTGTSFISSRIALSAVAPTPLFVPESGEALAGKEVMLENINQAAGIAQESAHPISDMRGTATQRKHLCAVLTRRALQKAIERARKTLQRE